MSPHVNVTIIIGRYMEILGEVLSGKTYYSSPKTRGWCTNDSIKILVLESDNRLYHNCEVKASDALGIWEYECNIRRNESKPKFVNP